MSQKLDKTGGRPESTGLRFAGAFESMGRLARLLDRLSNLSATARVKLRPGGLKSIGTITIHSGHIVEIRTQNSEERLLDASLAIKPMLASTVSAALSRMPSDSQGVAKTLSERSDIPKADLRAFLLAKHLADLKQLLSDGADADNIFESSMVRSTWPAEVRFVPLDLLRAAAQDIPPPAPDLAFSKFHEWSAQADAGVLAVAPDGPDVLPFPMTLQNIEVGSLADFATIARFAGMLVTGDARTGLRSRFSSFNAEKHSWLALCSQRYVAVFRASSLATQRLTGLAVKQLREAT